MSSIRCGFCGLGKLGLPVALALNSHGFDVCGTDINPDIESYLINRKIPYKEELADDLLKTHTIHWFNTIDEVIRNSDVVFMPVQTPHDKRYEGTTRLPPERKDFDYSYLIRAVQDFTNALSVSSDPSPKTLVIISTVLPGTIRREIIPIIEKDERIVLIYNPFFIAMGTTIHDFLNPEFVLLGVDHEYYPHDLMTIYGKIYKTYSKGFYRVMSIESAETVKVSYNCYITSKICATNTIMEICYAIPNANIDDVTNALKKATDRIVSPKYMSGGFEDSCACHPRDAIAMSWLSKKLGLKYDWFENMMLSRESRVEKWADLVIELKEKYNKEKIIILGYSCKANINLTAGSSALFLAEILKEKGEVPELYDPIINEIEFSSKVFTSQVYFIGIDHQSLVDFEFPVGSVVIDLFRMIGNQAGTTVLRIGE